MFTRRYLGPSRDGRTNRWKVICPCGTAFTPLTTMFRHQHVQCPKCRQEGWVDYNADDAPSRAHPGGGSEERAL